MCDFTDEAARDRVMREVEVGEVWRAGRATAAKLAGLGVTTAAQLRDREAKHARLIGTVVLDDLVSLEDAPRTLFNAPSLRAAAAMAAMNELNACHGRNTVLMAAAGMVRGWKLWAEHHSPSYMTRLAEVHRCGPDLPITA